jgi:hypothetical protein
LRGITKTYEETHKTFNNELYKLCTKCEEWFPCNEDYFYKNKLNKNDGFFPYCKECAKKKTIEQRDPDRVYELNKLYRTTRPHTIEARKRSNKKRVENGKYKEWQINNPEKLKGYNLYRELHKKHEITDEEWEGCKNYFNYRCAYCDLPIEEHLVKYNGKLINGDFHREHVNHDGANDISNCIPSCKYCNGQKHNFEFNDWYNENNSKFTKDRFDKINQWLNEDYKKHIN